MLPLSPLKDANAFSAKRQKIKAAASAFCPPSAFAGGDATTPTPALALVANAENTDTSVAVSALLSVSGSTSPALNDTESALSAKAAAANPQKASKIDKRLKKRPSAAKPARKVKPKTTANSSTERFAVLEEQSRELFCLCEQPYNDILVYIGCDKCDNWYHLSCVAISSKDSADKMDSWICPVCAGAHSAVRSHGVPSKAGIIKLEYPQQSCEICSNSFDRHSASARFCSKACGQIWASGKLGARIDQKRRDFDTRQQGLHADSTVIPQQVTYEWVRDAIEAVTRISTQLRVYRSEISTFETLTELIVEYIAQIKESPDPTCGFKDFLRDSTLTPPSSSSCQVPRKACFRHENWADIHVSEIEGRTEDLIRQYEKQWTKGEHLVQRLKEWESRIREI